ncbi:MAG: hypothetical protein DKT66_28290 [Candidatus Melainabacteria bacterium]|jgi:hypothetical protein|nr:MAG: hypothetical protein DKT66_28290 [Candidatus Melainabacteria bacterium]
MNPSRFCASEFKKSGEVVKVVAASLLIFSFLGSTHSAFAAQSQFRLNDKSVSSNKSIGLWTKLQAKEDAKKNKETASKSADSAAKTEFDYYQESELEELNSYAAQFKKRLDITTEKAGKHWQNVPFRHKLWIYTIDNRKFLGNCSVASLGHDRDPNAIPKIDPHYSYYLVLMHFNIPAVKATTIPLKYSFARFEAKIACQQPELAQVDPPDGATSDGESETTTDDKRKALKELKISESAEILSIYPENAILPIDRKDTTTVTLTAQPEWMGASGGKGEYSRAIEDSYAYKLPHVVGVGTRFGDVSWTFYPAKAQPIMLGSQSTFAVVKVPYKTSSLRILANLRYQLKTLKVLTFPPFRVCDWCDLDLRNAASFDDMAAIQYFGLPSDAREALQTAFGKGAVEHNLKYYGSQNSDRDILVDEKTGETYGFTDSCKFKKYKIKEE